MSDAKQKRTLLIGMGRWGANHLRVLKSMPIELFVADHLLGVRWMKSRRLRYEIVESANSD